MRERSFGDDRVLSGAHPTLRLKVIVVAATPLTSDTAKRVRQGVKHPNLHGTFCYQQGSSATATRVPKKDAYVMQRGARTSRLLTRSTYGRTIRSGSDSC